MNPELIGLVGIGILLALMFLGVPIALSMILVGTVGVVILRGFNPALKSAAIIFKSITSDYNLAVLPAFLIMGELAGVSGLMEKAYNSIATLVGKLPGGLAMASVLGASALSCVSGSSIACAAIMTRVGLPSLLKHKYDPALATGALAAGGTLGNLVPPGIILVVYVIMTDVSIPIPFR